MKLVSKAFPILVLLCRGSISLAQTPHFWDEIPSSPSTTLPAQVRDDYWNGEFQRVNREVLHAEDSKMIFFGDSITWYWSLGGGTGGDVWNERFSRYNPINMGNSGDITPVMLYRATHGNLDFPDGKQPKVAVLLCGVNNFGVTQSDGGKEKWDLGANCPPLDIANGQRALAQIFRRRMPETRLILMGILPVAAKPKWEKCQQVNAINAAVPYHPDEVAFIDLQKEFQLPDGSINRSLFTDGLHLTQEGYRVWAKGLEDQVRKFMDAPPLNPQKIMLVGDSITEGLDSNTTYRRYLDGMLRRSGRQMDLIGSRKKHNDGKTQPDNYQYDVDHEGHSGKDSAWLAENISRFLISKMPDVAVIHLGTEDIISSKQAVGPMTDGVIKNLGQVVDTLRSKNNSVKIVLSKITPMKGRGDAVDLLNSKISQYVQAHSTAPQSLVLADPSEGFQMTSDLADGGVLPNASGAEKIAAAIAKAIQRLP